MTTIEDLAQSYHVNLYRNLNHANRYHYLCQLRRYQQAGFTKHLPYLIQIISNIPDYYKRVLPWQQTLFKLTEAITIDEKTKQIRLAKSNQVVKNGALISWAYQNPDNGFKFEAITRLLKDKYRQLILNDKGYVLTPDTKSKASVNHGRRIVYRFKDEQQQLLAFAKVYPELPGRQMAVDNLTYRITGASVQATLAKLTPIVKGRQQQKASISLMLSKPAGITVQDWCSKQQKQPIAVDDKGKEELIGESDNLGKQGKQPANLNPCSIPLEQLELDSYHFSMKVIATYLIALEDDKKDNICLQQISKPNGS